MNRTRRKLRRYAEQTYTTVRFGPNIQVFEAVVTPTLTEAQVRRIHQHLDERWGEPVPYGS